VIRLPYQSMFPKMRASSKVVACLSLAGLAAGDATLNLDSMLQQLAGGGGGRGGGNANPLGGLANVLEGLGGGGPGRGASARLCEEGEVPVPAMDNHKAFTANGCGPDGMKIEEPFGLHRCCNFHDVCFSTCGTTHDWCENEFRVCMKRVCKAHSGTSRSSCSNQAAQFTSMTGAFGKGFHSSSQRTSCNCTPRAEAKDGHRAYLKDFLLDYDPEDAGDERVERLLETWKGKEGEMYAGLVHKHGAQFVRFRDTEPTFAQGRKMKLEL